MTRLFFDLGRSSWRTLLPWVLPWITFIAFQLGRVRFPAARNYALLFVLGAGVLFLVTCRWLWMLGQHARTFVRIARPPMVVYHDRELFPEADIAASIQTCSAALDEFQARFGYRLRRPVLVFVFSQWRDISAIFGKLYGGTALAQSNAIFVAIDNALHESIRHELTHLFTAKWNAYALPLMNEGLATWQQQTEHGQSIDQIARLLVENGLGPLTGLLDPKAFFDEEHVRASYVVAASFTGFLIRKYGWERYRDFFKRANMWLVKPARFEAAFAKCFGVPLEKAERAWRVELVAMPILRQRLEYQLTS